VPKSETILNGDVLTTLEDGGALVELKSGTRMQITKNSSVRFLGDGGAVQAELLSGAVISESVGKTTSVVTTPKYQFAPAQAGECRYVVQISAEQSTIASALEGNLLIQARNATGSYVLPQGSYAAISASAVGVPGQAPQAAEQPGARRAGTASYVIPDDVVQRSGQGAETALKVNDGIYWGDVVRTQQNGRLQIGLLDGSSLSIGPRSTINLFRHDPSLQQTEIQLSAGELRARAVKLIQEYASFRVETPTAAVGVVGTDLIVEAQADKTGVYCIEGSVSVENIDPDIAGKAILHPGEFTTVGPGRPPSAPMATPNDLLQNEISQTTAGPAPVAPGGPAGPGGTATATAAKAGWHIGSLSEGASIGVLAGAAGGVLGIALAAAGGHGTSTSPPPVSPSAP
jgi:hypothetical protein